MGESDKNAGPSNVNRSLIANRDGDLNYRIFTNRYLCENFFIRYGLAIKYWFGLLCIEVFLLDSTLRENDLI